ncbi:MAG: ABC transporter substrate-binding protein [Candidatus Binatia bacterium]|nr:MAG: ABC transporter substrate-binding protein [Candidatus Binatia bacterium]
MTAQENLRAPRGLHGKLARATRVVSLVPSWTETLFALGAGGAVVGRTRYCIEPPRARTVTEIGGTKTPRVEDILRLRPELVIVSAEENRFEDFVRLREAQVAVFVSLPTKLEDVVEELLELGPLVGCAEEARHLAGEIRRAKKEVEGEATARRRLRVFCPIWKNPWMTFRSDTYASAVLGTCGADNVSADAPDRYPLVSLDEVARAEPEALLLPNEPYRFGPRDLPSLSSLLFPRGPARQVRFVDGRALCWYGVRTPAGLRELGRVTGELVA